MCGHTSRNFWKYSTASLLGKRAYAIMASGRASAKTLEASTSVRATLISQSASAANVNFTTFCILGLSSSNTIRFVMRVSTSHCSQFILDETHPSV